jgi:hypothetical protein
VVETRGEGFVRNSFPQPRWQARNKFQFGGQIVLKRVHFKHGCHKGSFSDQVKSVAHALADFLACPNDKMVLVSHDS